MQNFKVPSYQPWYTEEIQKHLHQLKSDKASDDIDPEILKKCEHLVML